MLTRARPKRRRRHVIEEETAERISQKASAYDGLKDVGRGGEENEQEETLPARPPD